MAQQPTFFSLAIGTRPGSSFQCWLLHVSDYIWGDEPGFKFRKVELKVNWEAKPDGYPQEISAILTPPQPKRFDLAV